MKYFCTTTIYFDVIIAFKEESTYDIGINKGSNGAIYDAVGENNITYEFGQDYINKSFTKID